MGRSNRRQRRTQQNTPYEPVGNVEFPGIMGWMQRNGKILFLTGIVFMVLSVGAGAFASGLGNADPRDIVTPTPTSTADATATGEATPTEEPIERQYSSAPDMEIDPEQSYRAVIHLEAGDIVIDLLADAAPEYVNNFVFLARNRFYEGLTFHRVLPGFVAQAGDPLGTGTGGPGYTLEEETNNEPFEAGSLSMATSRAGVSGSQFFITLAPTPLLQDDFTVFGRVVEGMDILQGVTPRDPDLPGQPRGDVIQSIEIVEE
ncbi:MAG: peptidylprolyl isomerase [Dehalococcoidia bacterium]